MKYFLIAGEPSGDLHASNLMRALQAKDIAAEFVFYGGDKMKSVGGRCLRHYKEIAYMGFIPVLMHLRTILHAMKTCKRAIVEEKPDVVILIDYPGFNLSIARFLKEKTTIPVHYYILPKVWAWKEKRVKQLKAFVDERFSILPFEVPFFEGKHQCDIHYVGNPSVDEVVAYQEEHPADRLSFLSENKMGDKPIIALLPGSRVQEIKDNFQRMVTAVVPYIEKGYQVVVAGAPDISDTEYEQCLHNGLSQIVHNTAFRILRGQTFAVLQQAEAAVVTSGTAALETALFRVPQVVCYYIPVGKLIRMIKPYFLHVKYISLVNLILDRELVRELIGDEVNPEMIQRELSRIVKNGDNREEMLRGYEEMTQRLGPAGAPVRAAETMCDLLKS